MARTTTIARFRALRTLALSAALMLPASAGAPALAETGDTFSTSFASVGSPVASPIPTAGAVDITAIDPADEPAPGLDDTAARAIGGGVASYYADKFNGRRTASGESFSNAAMTAAHRSLPFGSKVRVTNPANGRSVVVRINDRGPFHGGRVIDLSRNAANQLGLVQRGSGRVELEILN
ncbi:septal ring lytic transglycosylase RlpA family protein [Tsuneonella sp. HG249]